MPFVAPYHKCGKNVKFISYPLSFGAGAAAGVKFRSVQSVSTTKTPVLGWKKLSGLAWARTLQMTVVVYMNHHYKTTSSAEKQQYGNKTMQQWSVKDTNALLVIWCSQEIQYKLRLCKEKQRYKGKFKLEKASVTSDQIIN